MLTDSHWISIKDGDHRAHFLYTRHYSCRHYADHRRICKIIGPGQYMLLITEACDALFAWHKFNDKSGQTGVCCSIFRNESDILSSTLILQAVQLALARWPATRLYTYINPTKIRSTNPGYCFRKAGWIPAGHTKKGLIILALPPATSSIGQQNEPAPVFT